MNLKFSLTSLSYPSWKAAGGSAMTSSSAHVQIDNALMCSDSYLGDIISSDGKNSLNIQERKRRGLVAPSQISDMLNDLCLRKYCFETEEC